jgi:hypothetical protein
MTKQSATKQSAEVKGSGEAKSPDTFKDLNDNAPATQTNMQKAADDAAAKTAEELTKDVKDAAKASDISSDEVPTSNDATAFEQLNNALAEALAQIEHLNKVVQTLSQNKAPPPVKKPRPAGKYRLTNALWNGSRRVEIGTVLTFAEGEAPQSAKYLG